MAEENQQQENQKEETKNQVQQVTTKDPKKVEGSRRLAVHSHR